MGNLEKTFEKKIEAINSTKTKSPIKFYMEENNEQKKLKIKIEDVENNNANLRKAMKGLTATTDTEIAIDILTLAAQAMPKINEQAHNFNIVSQALANFEPKDAIEARLVTQATVLHTKGMQYLEKADMCLQNMNDANPMEAAGFVNAHNTQMQFGIKLLRLHNETVETLSRRRRGNDQRITVQHVQVNDGGQAMVGNFQSGGRG